MIEFEANQPCHNPARRKALGKMAALSGVPLLGIPNWACAAQNLHSLPRAALILGNNRYSFAPLANPANDAKAMSTRLKELGFDVTVQTDLQRTPMEAAIQTFCAKLASTKAVGLFYYAGHGLQVNWRNYLVPIDASFAKGTDVAQQAVDLNVLLQGLAKAANPMNVVILDACRDNPFGGEAKTGKGLSQIDAPLGTLLAYATAPGNVAQDGNGSNGLYTENLLRELNVPEAKIEDVFKRVRLNVRRSSQGQQVPWESTSLEEDFYFLPPANIRKLSEKEKEEFFREEKAIFEQASETKTVAGFETYLKRYPSGNFSELAQLQLNLLLKKQGEQVVKIVSAPQNPYSRGSAEARTDHRIGDTYTYKVTDLMTKLVKRTFEQTITNITDSEIIYNDGQYIADLLGNWRKDWYNRQYFNAQQFPTDYVVGKRWSTRYAAILPKGTAVEASFDYTITSKETLRTDVGTFDTYRIDGSGGNTLGQTAKRTIWVAPERWRVPLAFEETSGRMGRVLIADRVELVAANAAN